MNVIEIGNRKNIDDGIPKPEALVSHLRIGTQDWYQW
jgi:hypothetical protein